MAEFVVDSNVWIASLVEKDSLHGRAISFFQEFESGLHRCHLPRLVFIEVCARIGVLSGFAEAAGVRALFAQWAERGHTTFHDLNEARAQAAVDVALRYRLRGADAIVAALGDELGFPLLTFDDALRQRYPGARSP